jgi:heterodisulfide reductase subunit B
MDEEEDYKGNINVVHLLEVLRDEVGWDQIASKVKKPLKDLKVAAYYGCTLHRPKEAAIEPPNKPEALNDLIKTLGATPVDFPDMTTCCGSYQAVANPEIVVNRTREILTSANQSGAEMIAVSCPLCECNLRENQKELGDLKMPIIYFTQLLALALGVDPHIHQCEKNPADARPLLESKGLLAACAAT